MKKYPFKTSKDILEERLQDAIKENDKLKKKIESLLESMRFVNMIERMGKDKERGHTW